MGETNTISRQAALDAIMGQPPEPHYPSWYAAQIEKLPAVQPDHVADVSKKVERTDETAQNVQDEDLISRKAAIDAVDVLCQEHRYKIPGKRETYSQYNEAWQDALDRAEGAIFNLPTVHPNHIADISKKADGDCISRQAVVKFFNDWISCLDENCHHQSVADMIIIKNDFKNLPSVQPESKWIPVSERLPEKNCRCLTTNEAWGSFEVDWNAWIDGQWLYPNEKPIAWRPFPEPYRGGEAE